MTLMPGDVLLTGTPAGIGAGMRPRRWLRDGDVVTVEIDGLGRLTNRFVQGESTAPAVDVTAP
jgi:2-keto-4-pentenoate hydratase/2-oxohepta-3-ene-1,7-dioic acid hydratase in catechol pathway